MFRSIPVLTFLALVYPADVSAQPGGLEGTYIHSQSNRRCYVYKRGRSYIFENERRQQATFAFNGQNVLSVIEPGEWDRDMQAHLTQGYDGRTVIRFFIPGRG